jgi:small subunit ribosomal protein S5
MTDEQKTTQPDTGEKAVNPAITTPAAAAAGEHRGGRERRPRRNDRRERRGEQDEFEQKIVDLARVTRVMAGGKRMRFRACVVIGDKKGRVGLGLAKSNDVSTAISKATDKAKKSLVIVQVVNGTIVHEIRHKFGAAKVLLKPAKQGRGIIAGGAVRIVLELAGLSNVVSKILGTNNQVANAKCVMSALQNLKKIDIPSAKIC